MREEARYPHDWHLALTTTEFVVHPDLRGLLAAHEPAEAAMSRAATGGGTALLRFPALEIIGNDSLPLGRFRDLTSQRSEYALCPRSAALTNKRGPSRGGCVVDGVSHFAVFPNATHRSYSRYLHCGFAPGTYTYSVGRHTFHECTSPSIKQCSEEAPRAAARGELGLGGAYKYREGRWIQDGLLLHYNWSPWPAARKRMMPIGGERQTASDDKKGGQYAGNRAGHTHSSKLDADRQQLLIFAERFELAELYEFVVDERGGAEGVNGGGDTKRPPPEVLALHRIFYEAGLAAAPTKVAPAAWRVAVASDHRPPVAACSPADTTGRTRENGGGATLARPFQEEHHDDTLDRTTFAVPTTRDACGEDAQWQRSSRFIFSSEFPTRFRRARGACVCAAASSGTALNWSLGTEWEIHTGNVTTEADGSRAYREDGPRSSDPCPAGNSMRHISGRSTVTHAAKWSANNGHQWERVSTALQLAWAQFADRHMSIEPAWVKSGAAVMTPFIRGLLDLFNTTLTFEKLGAHETLCFDEVIFVGIGNLYHGNTLRESRLDAQNCGSNVVPTTTNAVRFAKALRARCSMGYAPASHPPKTAQVLVRTDNRSFVNLDAVVDTLREAVPMAKVVSTDNLEFCHQLSWYDADIVVIVTGAHVVAQASMRPGQHVIEIVPYLHESDFSPAACNAHSRHVLVGSERQYSNVPGTLQANQRLCMMSSQCRKTVRKYPTVVPIAELRLLLQRILTGKTAEGVYRCTPSRCAYT